MKPRSRKIEVNGLRLHYLDWGGEADVPAIALHGFALNCHSWDEVAPALRSHTRIQAFDQRGHGLSEWATKVEDYNVGEMVSDLDELIDKLEHERPVLMGHSMGGINAMTFASRNPEKVRALVLVDVGPNVNLDGANEVVHFVAGPYELDSLEDWVEHTHRYYPYRSKERIRARLLTSLRKTETGKMAKQFDPRFRDVEFTGITRGAVDLWEIARGLRCPTLLVHGGASPILSREMAQEFADGISCVRLVSIPEAGHSVAGDKPEEFIRAVSEFFDDVL